MPVETHSLFTQIIQDHLRLKEQNAALEPRMPLRTYKAQDPFENHPLFKTEEQARLEETMNGEERVPADLGLPAWPSESEDEEQDVEAHAGAGLWTGRSRDFDWGD